MKVEFNEDGDLIVYAQNNTERVALDSWWKEYNGSRGEGVVFSVNVGEYLATSKEAKGI